MTPPPQGCERKDRGDEPARKHWRRQKQRPQQQQRQSRRWRRKQRQKQQHQQRRELLLCAQTKVVVVVAPMSSMLVSWVSLLWPVKTAATTRRKTSAWPSSWVGGPART